MPTSEKAYQDIVKHIEENRLEAALAALLSFAGQDSPDKMDAVRMRRSDWKTLEEEALMMGNTSGIRERRSALKLQLFRLADAILKDAVTNANLPSSVGPAYSTLRGEDSAKPQKGNIHNRTYDTAGLRAVFRQGNTHTLIQQVISMTDEDRDVYDQALLLEQRWKEVSEDEKNNTASAESITTRRNKLNQDILRLIREMEG